MVDIFDAIFNPSYAIKISLKESRTLSKKKSFWLKYFIPRLPSTINSYYCPFKTDQINITH